MSAFYYPTAGDTFGKGIQLAARSTLDGHVLWTTRPGDDRPLIEGASTVVVNGHLYALANGGLYDYALPNVP